MQKRIDIETGTLEDLGIDFDPERYRSLEPPLIMGILNVTPDSFSDGGRFDNLNSAVDHAIRMVEEGADIIDVGGESTRPFADKVPVDDELKRVIPVISKLAETIDVPLSIDTRHTIVAREALKAGASMVNDVNGLRDPGMEDLVAETGVNAIMMHMKGTPKDMQVAPTYDDTIDEIHDFLLDRVETMISKGCRRDHLIIDPGIGFGKRVEDNLMILKDLHRYEDIGCPILVGASRKSFIGAVLGLDVDHRLEGSLASAVIAYMNGASILRVHDVKETRRSLDLAHAVQNL